MLSICVTCFTYILTVTGMLQRLTENTVCNHSKAISMALGLILFNITVIYNLKFSEKS